MGTWWNTSTCAAVCFVYILITQCAGYTYLQVGDGASTQSLLWNILGFVYQGVDPTSQIQYTPTSSGAGATDIENRVVDFAGSDPVTVPATLNKFGLAQFPIACMYCIYMVFIFLCVVL